MKLIKIDFKVVCNDCGCMYHKIYYIGQTACEFCCPECDKREVYDYVNIDCEEDWGDDE